MSDSAKTESATANTRMHMTQKQHTKGLNDNQLAPKPNHPSPRLPSDVSCCPSVLRTLDCIVQIPTLAFAFTISYSSSLSALIYIQVRWGMGWPPGNLFCRFIPFWGAGG